MSVRSSAESEQCQPVAALHHHTLSGLWPCGSLFFLCVQDAPQKVTIGLAHSTNGLEWTKVQGPGEGGCILERGASGSDWDHDFVMSPSLVQGADGMWQLHYFGGRMSTRWGSMHQRAVGCGLAAPAARTVCAALAGILLHICQLLALCTSQLGSSAAGCVTAEHPSADGHDAWLTLAKAESD